MKKIWIYVIGIAPLGYFYEALKGLMSGPVFLGLAIIYLFVVRWIAEKFGK
jgi:hypothetical protein